jgi:hypothetical protein
MLRLFTTFYKESRAARAAEYRFCLERNLASCIDQVCILTEAQSPGLPESKKIRVRQIDRRPTYDDFFRWINELAQPEDFSLISNSDIWFDDSIGVALGNLTHRECLAITRWDGNTLFDRNDSQDSWAWRGQVRAVRGDYPLGVPRCDNRLLYELRAAGYAVLNPALSVRTHHVHEGIRGEYTPANMDHFVEGPYGYLWPHNLRSLPRTLAHNLRHPERRIDWRLDRRKIATMLPFRALRKVTRMVLPESAKA